MRLRSWPWILLCLLLAAGAWFFWRPANPPAEKAAPRTISPSVPSSLTAANLPGAAAATNANPAGAVKTNRFAYRLANTAKPIGELVRDPQAILLENALIDTSGPLNLSIPKNLQAHGDAGAYIVQARGPVNAAFYALLASAGATEDTFKNYIPNNAYLTRLSPAAAESLKGSPLVQAVLPYEPYYKISASIPVTVGSRAASSTSKETHQPAGPSLLTLALKQAPLPVGTYLILGLFGDNAAATVAQIEKLGGRILARDNSPFGPVVRVQPPEDWVALATLPGVQIVEPFHPRIHANDLSRARTSVAADSQVSSNYLGLTGKNVIVAVPDSGIDATHPDLTGRVLGLTPGDLVDTNGHGTHVAGTIAGDGTESMTVVNAQGSIMPATNGQFRGMAPAATLLSMGLGANSDQQLQEMAALTNALISNNSWNNDGNTAYDLAAASYDAATRDALPEVTGSQPVLFVFSAGNDGGGDDSSDPGDGTADTILSPATAKDVIAVGAIQEHRNITNIVTTITVNSDGTTTTNSGMIWQPETSTSYRVAGFSARGNVGIGTEGTYGRFKPDVVAPGTFVISTRSSQWDIANYFLINPTNHDIATYSNIVVQPDALWASIFPTIPGNTVGISINVGSNPDSPSPFPSLPLYAGLYTSPNLYDFSTTVNPFVIPGNPDATFTLQDILNTEGFWGFNFAVSNSTAQSISFDVTTDVITTNNPGDHFLVLSNLDQNIGGLNPNSTGPGPYYRYETGTSMSAADVSGVLALMQQFFTNNFGITPSPALMKAALINGARVSNAQVYNLQVTNTINHEGWGLVNLTNSLPGVIGDQFNTPCDDFFVDQSPTNALATGDSHTYTVIVSTNSGAQNLPLRVTLAWTDPPGNPAAAIKLVNSLEVVVTNSDNPSYPIVYYGNDIGAGQNFNTPENPTNAANVDAINNVQNVFIYPLPGADYSITVIGRQVNVNAVTQQKNNVVQDYALVISYGEGEATNALSVTDKGIVSNPTGDQQISFATSTNQPLFNQFVGAASPLLGTNAVQLGLVNEQVTAGMTNQWHFYVMTNNALDRSGVNTDVTNAVFITFDANTLSIPREGVFANSTTNATRPQADIDLYVASGPNASGLTNLDPMVISNCVNGTQVGNSVGGVFNGAALTRGGTEFVVDTNSTPGQVYYIGVKSEDRMASEYSFIPIFTSIPPSGINANGDEVVNGLNVPVAIPDGTPAHPGLGLVFGVAMYPIQVERVVVTNQVWHQNFGDLIGTLTLNGSLPDVLNNHDSVGNTIGLAPLTYDDSGQNDIGGSRPSDGPGSLNNYVGQGAFGVWELAEADDSPAQIGTNESLTLLIQPHRSLTGGLTNTIPGHSWSYNYIDVPPGYTNLSVFGTNLPPTSVPPLQMYLNVNSRPTFANYLTEADLTNGTPPGNSISYGPPLAPGRYWVGVYNPDNVTHDVYLLATLGGILTPVPTTDFSANGLPLPDDAVTPTSIFVGNTQLISSVNVALVVDHPRISDLTFTLVSPTGQRVLLMENRGGVTATNLGHLNIITNFFQQTLSQGGPNADTNVLAPVPTVGTLVIDYDFFQAPDTMDVYYDGADIFSTTSINPPSGLISGAGTFTIPYGPGVSTNIVIVMNQNGNPDTNTLWQYQPRVISEDFNYVTFTENTNLTDTPIKFAVPPYDLPDTGTNFTISGFESDTGGDYLAPTNIFDPLGGWDLFTNHVFAGTNLVSMSNQVSVVADPSTAQAGSNYLALADGTISRAIPLAVGRKFTLAYSYRGPGIAGWWRGEGNALDSADPEFLGDNGTLVGRFNYPAGEAGQAFEFADAGQAMEFAGTNTYVQIRQSPSLDVGAGGGFTVEGWINPTNVSFQQPLVEWLARVPTNAAVTNLVIAAGPYLNRATDHFYYLLGATNWTVSEFWAEQLGGHLATIDTANEQNWVRDAFGSFGNTNRNLWIGLTNRAPGTFVWSSGLTNVAYTNWANGQPDNTCGTANYTFMLGATNAPGLWTLANNNGFTCANPAKTNFVLGVVEVADIQTNGVQFWISATNTPDTANAPFAASNGCLYANIVDTNNVAHEIFSAPGLVQSNVYQHVALTYNTNSGLAMLYYNGTNVATTNLGVFVPKTGGDVLLGRDMSRATNNYFGGEMDEMSIYSRTLSPSEIHAIYEISALSTNRNVGKFDPSVTPAEGLAEARVSLGGMTNTIFGVNKGWQVQGFTFTAVTNSLPLQITGVEPGMLLDSFGLSEAPIGNVYYLPEQSLSELAGNSAYGNWTLQIWDNRAGAYVTNAAQLVNWQLQFVLQTNGLAPTLALNPQDPATITVPPRGIVPLLVNVPSWASSATNLLVSATGPVDLLFNPAIPPTGANPGDLTLLGNSTGGKGIPDLNGTSTPPLPPNSYYLGVRNNSAQTITAVVEVDFNITTLSNGVPMGGVLNPNDQERYFAYDVSSNAFEATFQLLHLSGNADLVVRKGPPLPTLLSSDFGSFNVSNADENIYVLTNTQPVPLSPGRWYLGVFKRDTGPVSYTVLAKELDATSGTPGYTVIDLTNRVPFNFTAGPGAALTNFFRFNVANTFFLTTNAANGVTTNTFGSIHFELYNLSGDGDLTVQTDAPPFAPPFFESSRQPDREPELIVIRTNSVLTNLVAPWYLGVPNNETNLITYTIVAELDTNLVFPAFPGAEGAGAGAIGGRFGGVYHVTSLADSGAGTLRDAVSVTNRTIVFDVSGTIYLQSPLVITNSFLTIAGQTAPGDGITVAGNMTVVQSVHDVVIRYVRFRSGYSGTSGTINPAVVWSNGFEGGVGTFYPGAGSYFDGGWLVDFGSVDCLTNGYSGSTPYQGNYFLDLDGSSAGGISTNITTIPGVTYTLSFAYSKNPGVGATPTPQAVILINGNPLATLTANIASSWTSLAWQTTSLVFTATSPSTSLAFHSLDPSGSLGGVLLDAVSLTANLSNVASTPLSLNDFEGATAADYMSGQVVANSGWKVSANQVSLVTDPVNAYSGSNFLALANGVISTTLPTVAGNTYTFTFAYRGPGIVGWWRGEANALDSISGTSGTYLGQANYTSGEVGTALSFNGVNNGVRFPASASLNVGAGNGMTIEAWVNPSTINQLNPVVEWNPGTGANYGTHFWLNHYNFGSGNFFANLVDTAGNWHVIKSSPGYIVPNVYQHVALTYNKNSGNAALFYQGSPAAAANLGTFTLQTTYGVYLGERPPGDPDSAVFTGGEDEISIYNRPLSDSEIQAIYQNGTAGKFDPAVFSTSPAQSLAEAQVSVNGQTQGLLYGNNTNWQVKTITFTATQNGTPVQISGIEPGMLLDAASASVNADDALRLTNVSDVVADHVSTSWSTNNDLSVLNSSNVTVQWSMMADSIYDPLHPHGYGSRLRYGNGALAFHHNLYADNYNASPRLGDNLALDFVNNVIYNWDVNAGFSTNDVADNPSGFTNELNYACNYLIAGPNSVMTNIAFWSGTPNTWIFQTNNFMDSNLNGILDGADTGWSMFTNQYTPLQVPFPPLAESIDEAFLAYERVLDFAGAAMDKRDAADTNIVGGVRGQTGVLISAPGPLPALNSLLPFLDTDRDGIPDFWEITFGQNPTNASNNQLSTNPNLLGYTDLEEYLAWLAGPHALTVTNTSVGVDLMQMFGKTGNLSFSVTNAVQGFVYLTNVLNYTNNLGIVTSFTNTGAFSNSIAVFTPTNNAGATTNYSGYAGFDVFATNNSTIAYFGPVTVSVVVSAVPIAYAKTNTPPVLSTNIPDQVVNELTTLTVTNTATDANTNLTLTYTVTMTVDTNAMVASNWPTIYATTIPPPEIDPTSGIITWTPSEAQGPGVYIITTVVTDNGIPPLSATNSFTVVVNETNAAPFWPANVSGQTNYAVNELTLLTVTNTASDSDIPTNALAYTVTMSIDTNAMIANGWPLNYATTNPPPGIDPTNGVITWTPGEAQGPGVYILTTVVTDTNIYALANQSLSATNRITVTVNEVNTPPFWPPGVPSQANYAVNELTLLTVTNTAADLDIPPNPLTYRLIGPPGAGIDANNGIITWIPAEAQGPGVYIFTTVVMDTNIYALANRSLSATNSFTVTVFEVNTAPYWTNSFELVTMDELTTNLVNAAALDADLPANTLSYALTNSPTWAVIDSNSGIITLTPQEADGPGTNVITVRVTDNGAPPLSATTNFTVVVNEVNTPPFWPPGVPSQTNYVINALSTLVVANTATDLDIPPNPLTYQLLVSPAVTNATINPTNGIITWTPTLAQAPGLYTFTTIVTDTNVYALTNQSLSATNSFTVTVLSVFAPFVFTQPATPVTGTNAQLNGMATPNGLPTTVWFEWGANTLYGNQTPPVSVGNSFNVVYTTNQISGLVTNVPYHFRLVASNAVGVIYGFDQILDEANVVVWGADYAGQLNEPAGLSNVVAIAGANDHSLALKSDGTAVSWGDNPKSASLAVPAGLNNLVAVAGGDAYSLALKNNGTIVTWGVNTFPGETNVPAGLNNVVTIASGTYSSLALKNNGTVVAWGAPIIGLTNVPAGLSNAVAIAGGDLHSLAIKNDGTVVAWGIDTSGDTVVPANLTNVVAISAGGSHSLALKYDGTVVAWGDDTAGQTDVPPGLTNVVAIAAGGYNSLALRNDGSVVAWGYNSYGQTSVPVGLTNAVAIAAGNLHGLALTPQSVSSLINPVVLDITNGVPETNNIFAGGVVFYKVNVPTNADFSTNSLLYTLNGPLNVWFTTNTPPTIATINDSLLFGAATNGVSILSTTSMPTNIVPGSTYYLGVQNTNHFAVNYGIGVNFHLVTVTSGIVISGIIYTNIGGTNGFLLTWFAPSNDLFQVQWSGSLPPTSWSSFTNIVSYNPNAFTSPTNTQFNYFDDGSQYPFTGLRFYRLILLSSTTPTNPAPVLPAQTNQVINVLNALIVTNTASDAAVPAPVLTYVLTSTVVGTNPPVINATNGVITWTPDAAQAGTSNVLTTVVTAGGVPGLSATNSFAVVVNPLPALGSVTYTNGGFLLTWYAPTNDQFKVQFTDSLAPQNWQSFSNIIVYTGPPTPTNGLFSFFDDGTQYPFSGLRFYRLVLLGVASPAPTNPAPVLPAQTNRVINVLNALIVTNTASDAAVPTPVLTYTLTSTVVGTNPPVINPTNGVITWTPDAAQSGTSNVLTTVVTASGAPALSATNSFAVVVNPLPVLGNVIYTNGGFLLTWFAPTNDQFHVQFTDSLAPQNWQSFSNIVIYTGPPTPTNGLFSFFDDGSQYPFSGPRFYRLILLGVTSPAPTNPPPVLPLQTNRVINPLTPLIVTNTASDAAVPTPVLTYSLTSNVVGTNQPVINATNGVITWTPDAAQSGTSNVLTTVVTASGAPALSATNSFAVVVNPLPVLGSVIYTNGGFLLTWFAPTNDQFMVQFTDSLAPQNWQSFSNIVIYTGPVTPTNGLFTFFDDGSQYPFIGLRFYRLILLGLATPPSTNPPPVLPAQTDRVINPLTPLIVTNTASDAAVPAPVLTYTLSSTVSGTNLPTINTNTGIITWTPDLTQSGTSNVLTTVVTASGVPALSATNSFAVLVNPLPVLNNIIYTNGDFLLTWLAPTNDIFEVQVATDLSSPISWQTIATNVTYTGPVTPTNGWFSYLDTGTEVPFGPIRFYRLILMGLAPPMSTNPPPVLPAQADRVINPLTPLIVTNSASDAAVPAPVLTYTLSNTVSGTNQPTINTNTGVITWTPDVTQAGTSNVLTTVVTASGAPALSATNSFAVVVNPVPALSSVIYTNGGFLLTWYAPTNDQFNVQWSTNLIPPVTWIFLGGPITSTNGTFTFADTNAPSVIKYYRLWWLLP